MTTPLRIGLLGGGVVGTGVVAALAENSAQVTSRAGRPLQVVGVAVRDLARPRPGIPAGLLTDDPAALVARDDVDVVVELMGGLEPASGLVRQALEAGKPVVTANKELIAAEGQELHRLAARHGVPLLYEASAGGAIPVVATLRDALAGNRVRRLRAIINGTTNYILTRMAAEGQDFRTVLADAQRLGYAEADPANDVEGHDAAYKLAILAGIAFGTAIPAAAIPREGITGLDARDFRYAQELGYAIKLIAQAQQREDGQVSAGVFPALVPMDQLLARVDGVFNAVEVETDLAGDLVLTGRGAGGAPTASAVIGDLVAIARGTAAVLEPVREPFRAEVDGEARYYILLIVQDRPGVLARLAQICADHRISIASVLQKETHETDGTAELVIMTHLARQTAMRQALEEFAALEAVVQVASALRVEGGRA